MSHIALDRGFHDWIAEGIQSYAKQFDMPVKDVVDTLIRDFALVSHKHKLTELCDESKNYSALAELTSNNETIRHHCRGLAHL